AQLMWKRFVDPALAAMDVDRSPDRLAALLILRQAMPVIPDPFMRSAGGVMQTDLVFASSAMPDCNRALAAGLQIIPQRHLMRARLPASIGQLDINHCASSPQ